MGVLFGIFSLILVVFGVVALFAAPPAWAFAHFLGAVILFGLWMASGLAQFREFWARGATRRGLKYGGNTALQTALVGAILVGIAFLSVRYFKHWDWTEGGVHSLSPGSREVLEQIPADGEVEILAFYVQGAQDEGQDLLDQYGFASERVKVNVYDPNKRPDLAQRHEINASGTLLVCGGPCATAKGTVRVSEASEQELTKAIRSVISEKRKVYFLTGHGEGDPERKEADGYSNAKIALEDENMAVETLLLANQENVPEDADAVVIAGPDHSLLDRELEALDRYLTGGGSLLVLSEPIVVSNIEDRVRAWGVELGKDIVIDQQIQLFGGPTLAAQPIATTYGAHPITQDLAKGTNPTLFQVARTVRAAEGVPEGEVVELVQTGKQSWAESEVQALVDGQQPTPQPPADRMGPVALVVSREFTVPDAEKKRGGRLVVAGDADFVRNRYIAEFANADLFLNAVNWLVGEESFITIERKRPRASMVVMSADQVNQLQYLSIFVLPELVLLLGVWNWWRRRT